MAVEKNKLISVYGSKTKAELKALKEANVLGFPTDDSSIVFGDKEYGTPTDLSGCAQLDNFPSNLLFGNGMVDDSSSNKVVLRMQSIDPRTGDVKDADYTINQASSEFAGVMSTSDKVKVDNLKIYVNDGVFTSDDVTGTITLNTINAATGESSGTIFDIPRASTTKAGVMSADDKVKLNSTYTKTETDSKISAAIGSVYKVKGTKATIAEVIALTDAKVGDTWNVTGEFTLSGKKYPAGTNVVCVTATSSASHAEANWDALGGTVDLSPYALKGNLPTSIFDMSGIDSEYEDKVRINGNARNLQTGENNGNYYIIPAANDKNAGVMSAADKVKLNGIQAGAQVNAVTSVAGRTGAVTLSKADVGLGNVANESKETMFTNAALTGTPTAPTAALGTETNQIATTAFVMNHLRDLDGHIKELLGSFEARIIALENALKVK